MHEISKNMTSTSQPKPPRHGRLILFTLVLALPLLLYPALAVIIWSASLWLGLRPN